MTSTKNSGSLNVGVRRRCKCDEVAAEGSGRSGVGQICMGTWRRERSSRSAIWRKKGSLGILGTHAQLCAQCLSPRASILHAGTRVSVDHRVSEDNHGHGRLGW
jgi:hypothetical protein